MTPERIQARYEPVASGFGMLEAPTIHDGHVLASDIHRGGVHEIDLADGATRVVVPHRRGIGGIAVHTDGIVVTGRNVSIRFGRRPEQEQQVLLDTTATPGVLAFNDLAVDPKGRIYVGSLSFKVAEGYDTAVDTSLYRIDTDGTTEVVDDDLLLPNGMAFSPDGSVLYVCDSLQHVIWSYDVDSQGHVSSRRCYARVEDGLLDGVAIDTDGRLWVAMAHRGAIHVIAEGEIARTYEFPMPMVTSLCFAERDEEPILLVTTGDEGAPRDLGGGLLRMPVDVHGAPVWSTSIGTSSDMTRATP